MLPANSIIMSFWAEQYALPANGCTTLHWSVKNVQKVYLSVNSGAEEGVAGESSRDKICPGGNVLYKLRAVAADGTSKEMTVLLQAPPPAPSANEAYAQGLISKVVSLTDADAIQGGDQPGWEITIDGVNPILKGTGPCCQQAIKIKLLESQATAYPKAYPSWVDWPLQAGPDGGVPCALRCNELPSGDPS